VGEGVQEGMHIRGWLADREPAERVAVEADRDQLRQAGPPDVQLQPALHDAVECLVGPLVRCPAAPCPGDGPFDGGPQRAWLGRQWRAFIECHDDVGAKLVLDGDG